MTQTICDRCRAVIKPTDIKYPRYTISSQKTSSEYKYYIDLCRDCEESLKEWLHLWPDDTEGEEE